MSEHGIVLEAALAIRSELPALLDAPGDLDRRLLDLLGRLGQGEPVDGEIVELLVSERQTREWTEEFLTSGVPPGYPQPTKTVSPLPGRRAPVPAARYACPVDGLYVWYRRSVGQDIPSCRDHPDTQLLPRRWTPQ
jgi:hypothetical protein